MVVKSVDFVIERAHLVPLHAWNSNGQRLLFIAWRRHVVASSGAALAAVY